MNYKKSVLFFLTIILYFSCSKEEIVAPVFFVDITADSFIAEGGSKTITLSSNISWSASSSETWLSVTPSNGMEGATITLTASENKTSDPRAAVVTLTPKTGQPIKINVTQATIHQFHVDVRQVTLLVDAEPVTINLTSKISWKAESSADWLTITPEEGSENKTLTLTASRNGATVERSATVTITPAIGVPIKIPVTQNGIQLSTDVTEITFNDSPDEKTIILTSSVAWIASSNADWVTINPENGTGLKGEIINITVRRNETGEERTAIITITPEIGEPLVVTILQKGAAHVAEIIKYVATNAKGNGNGVSEDNAADFRNSGFWTQINDELQAKSVEVKFLPGDYVRAYTSAGSAGTGLIFDRMGNENNRLILTGGKEVIFTVPEGYATRGTLIRFHGSQNITFRDFHFTGNGDINYVLAIRTPAGFPPSRNILIENCTWTEMRGTVYGATGCHYEGTTDITYRNCTFKRIGVGTGSHMMYHAYGPTHIRVINCYFENCTGEYVRFRDRSDFAMVKNCTFNRHTGWIGAAFISIPNYNNEDPGNEYFGTNYSFTGNLFQNTRYGIQFRHTGFSPKEYNYLLTAEEGAILENGTKAEKMKLLKDNFNLDVSKIRITNNSYPGVYDKYVSINSGVMYGAISLGWTGTADITTLFDPTTLPFDWEE